MSWPVVRSGLSTQLVVPTVPFDRRMLLAGGVAVAGLLAVASGLVIVDRSASVRLSEFTHPWVKKLIAGCRQAIDSLARVLTAPRALGAIVGGSLLIWALDVATAVLVLGSLVSASTPLTLVLVGTVAVAAGNVAKILPLTQGGVGLYEAAFAAVIVSSTPIALEIALLAAILDHGLKNVVTGAGGTLGVCNPP
ncbi:MAG: lysylphosphatidylglycerol synthase domain-containing protein [Natrialbaceae archaeon]|nr:lysylphosphatidylglycerol synthase domain-containing protein [Natrialbaceae archaeon]